MCTDVLFCQMIYTCNQIRTTLSANMWDNPFPPKKLIPYCRLSSLCYVVAPSAVHWWNNEWLLNSVVSHVNVLKSLISFCVTISKGEEANRFCFSVHTIGRCRHMWLFTQIFNPKRQSPVFVSFKVSNLFRSFSSCKTDSCQFKSVKAIVYKYFILMNIRYIQAIAKWVVTKLNKTLYFSVWLCSENGAVWRLALASRQTSRLRKDNSSIQLWRWKGHTNYKIMTSSEKSMSSLIWGVN